ncbi:Putative glutathione S-transferase, Thioredoxin-like superfamily [Septoria linicola]|uniref:Glutathione S-transferase, Thioredoxin-like superfamily n=1 Tax=Septoria linicola TaxID=215465 RepID=A0A9Q9AR69_9PEZI|nr:Putative glutathione S-transferase, Thioredoxin-like superfamily [Septoria linicola]
MSEDIILYDLPSRGTPKCWSLNPWKARLALNYKNLPYKTEWLEYPSVAPALKSYGIPPNSPSLNPNASYSIPAIRLPPSPTSSSSSDQPTYTMDSLAIAHALESQYPTTPSLLFSGNDYAARAQSAINTLMPALQPIALPRVPELLLNEVSAEYFNSTREKRFGMPLSSLAQSESASPEYLWGEGGSTQPGLKAIKELLEENEGRYVQGEEVSFADFILVGCWRFLEILDQGGDLFGKVMEYDERIRRHYEVCRVWLERDD